tara:strand:- start:440 stop:1399 length:960 start_codon:yes stop_codon:yes gene_type:complete
MNLSKEFTPTAEIGLWSKIKKGLTKSRHQLASGLESLFLGEREIDASLLDEIEMVLLSADVGLAATEAIIGELVIRVERNQLADGDALKAALAEILTEMLLPLEGIPNLGRGPNLKIILFVGVNGAGKTTTIGKLSYRLKKAGNRVVLAGGDTFRAAASEQLGYWADQAGVEAVLQQQGADSASVIFDAIEAARARDLNILIADTAGRLQSQKNLMEELAKINRVIKTQDSEAPHETLLVLDATVGQNSLQQLREFDELLGISGLIITKLDGTAKAGVLLSIAKSYPLPIYFVGVGEALDDLQPFSAEQFVKALLTTDI